MKPTANVLITFVLSVLAIEIACTSGAPANMNQPAANTNTASAAAPQSKASSQPTSNNIGTIDVSSTPRGARVLLVSTGGDGAGEPQPKGLTPTTITGIQPGKYTVDIEMPGYRFFQKEVTVKAGATVRVTAKLKKQ